MPNNLGREAAQLAAAVEAATDDSDNRLFRVQRTTRRHYLFFTNGGTFVCDLSGTPGSKRALDNTRAMLKRAGFNPNPMTRKKGAR